MKKFKRMATVGHISSTSRSPFHAYYMSFRSSGSEESNTLNGDWIGVETKKLWLFEDNCTKLSEMSCENFAGCLAAAKPPLGTRVPFHSSTPSFRSYEMGCKMACENVPWLRTTLRNHLQAANEVANHLQVAESSPSCEITNSTCKIKVQTWKMDNSTCESSPCEIHLCTLRYLLPTKLYFFLKIFCVNFYFFLVISQRYYWDIS